MCYEHCSPQQQSCTAQVPRSGVQGDPAAAVLGGSADRAAVAGSVTAGSGELHRPPPHLLPPSDLLRAAAAARAPPFRCWHGPRLPPLQAVRSLPLTLGIPLLTVLARVFSASCRPKPCSARHRQPQMFGQYICGFPGNRLQIMDITTHAYSSRISTLTSGYSWSDAQSCRADVPG